MKKALLLIGSILCFSVHALFAQKEHNIWYFGSLAGLDFNSGSPVAITNSAMSVVEGCSTICDTSGNILFYTEGTKIWNKNHVFMANGLGLSGNSTSTQSALIVKQPGNPNLYYVFTTFTTLNYSIVDMNLNGGLGDVTASKNVFMINGSEKLCGTAHSNGTDIWILSHESGTNGYNAFILSSTGITAVPVHSNTGIVTSGGPGQMKFSPSGDKVAFGTAGGGMTTYLAYFNNANGIVSGGFSIPTKYNQNYGLEFSPDGNILYTTSNPPDTIFQFNLNAGSAAAIIASATPVGNCYPNAAASMQIGPDQKIYLSPSTSGYVDVINSPNTLGVGCNFVHNAVFLNGKICQLGLPGSIASFYYTGGLPPVALFQSSDTISCAEGGTCINFFDHSSNSPMSWKWLFPGALPDTSSQQNPVNICYTQPGTYAVTLIVTNTYGTDTLAIAPMITLGTTPPAPVITLYGGDTLVCSHATSYQWYYNGVPIFAATDSFYVAVNDGSYNIYITDSLGCSRFGNGFLFTSINELTFYPIGVYPNPSNGDFEITFPSATRASTAKIQLFNTLGEIAYLEEQKLIMGSNTFYLHCNKLAAGIYVLCIYVEGEVSYQKVVIEK